MLNHWGCDKECKPQDISLRNHLQFSVKIDLQ